MHGQCYVLHNNISYVCVVVAFNDKPAHSTEQYCNIAVYVLPFLFLLLQLKVLAHAPSNAKRFVALKPPLLQLAARCSPAAELCFGALHEVFYS